MTFQHSVSNLPPSRQTSHMWRGRCDREVTIDRARETVEMGAGRRKRWNTGWIPEDLDSDIDDIFLITSD